MLLNGRLLYPDRSIYGERVALVDEQLAVALFQYAEPLGEEIEVAGQRYRIVGVIKAGKRVGDQMDYSLYVPLRSLEETNVSLTALVYEARPVQGAGGWSAFQTAAQKLGDGTTISLLKERMERCHAHAHALYAARHGAGAVGCEVDEPPERALCRRLS